MAVLCGMPTIQYLAGSTRLHLIGGCLGPSESSNANSISIASDVIALIDTPHTIVYIATSIDILCPNFVKFGRQPREIVHCSCMSKFWCALVSSFSIKGCSRLFKSCVAYLTKNFGWLLWHHRSSALIIAIIIADQRWSSSLIKITVEQFDCALRLLMWQNVSVFLEL